MSLESELHVFSYCLIITRRIEVPTVCYCMSVSLLCVCYSLSSHASQFQHDESSADIRDANKDLREQIRPRGVRSSYFERNDLRDYRKSVNHLAT
jgi:hypothetical protein